MNVGGEVEALLLSSQGGVCYGGASKVCSAAHREYAPVQLPVRWQGYSITKDRRNPLMNQIVSHRTLVTAEPTTPHQTFWITVGRMGSNER